MRNNMIVVIVTLLVFSSYGFKKDYPPSPGQSQALEGIIVWNAEKIDCDTYKVHYDSGDFKIRTIKENLYSLQKKGFDIGDIVELSKQ